jgi:hypothetical protein
MLYVLFDRVFVGGSYLGGLYVEGEGKGREERERRRRGERRRREGRERKAERRERGHGDMLDRVFVGGSDLGGLYVEGGEGKYRGGGEREDRRKGGRREKEVRGRERKPRGLHLIFFQMLFLPWLLHLKIFSAQTPDPLFPPAPDSETPGRTQGREGRGRPAERAGPKLRKKILPIISGGKVHLPKL